MPQPIFSFVMMNVCAAVPDPPRNLQLSCDNGEDGTVEVSWSPPDKGHGLIREYIVSFYWIKLIHMFIFSSA